MRSIISCIAVTLAVAVFGVPSAFAGDADRILRITERGIDPPELRMSGEDSSVFFFNDSRDSLITFEIDFGGKQIHCASSNAKIGNGGTVQSTKPLGPRDFATTCFHDPGSYPVTFYGVKGHEKGLSTVVTVE